MNKELSLNGVYSDAEIARLNELAFIAEAQGTLTDEQIELLTQKGFLKLFVPNHYEGLQMNLPDVLPILEKTSYIDGSLGWSLTLIAGAGFLGPFMHPEFAQSFFTNNNAILSGSGFPGGKAKWRESSYTVSGKWKYATAIEHATLITATCFITEDGTIQQKNGTPLTKAFAFYPDEITVQKTWNSLGLKATGSHNFEVHRVRIPEQRTFTITPETSHVDAPLYHYSFDAFAHATLAVSLLGIADRFLDEAKLILQKKNDVAEHSVSLSSQESVLKHSNQTFHQACDQFYKTVNASWNDLLTKGNLPGNISQNVCEQSRLSCQKALDCVQNIYPFLGMSAIQPDTVINRCWRDIHTASQHMFLRPK